MRQFRVTKYNPAHRDALGRFSGDDWTCFSQVGTSVRGVRLTLQAYEGVERAYIQSAQAFLQESGVRSLTARGVENARASPEAPREGEVLAMDALAKAMQHVLRNEYWCRFEAPSAFVHFGWDFYMYVGVPQPCEAASVFATTRGLFVEAFDSPYREA